MNIERYKTGEIIFNLIFRFLIILVITCSYMYFFTGYKEATEIIMGYTILFAVVVVIVNRYTATMIMLKEKEDTHIPFFYPSDLDKIYKLIRKIFCIKLKLLAPVLVLMVGFITGLVLYNYEIGFMLASIFGYITIMIVIFEFGILKLFIGLLMIVLGDSSGETSLDNPTIFKYRAIAANSNNIVADKEAIFRGVSVLLYIVAGAILLLGIIVL